MSTIDVSRGEQTTIDKIKFASKANRANHLSNTGESFIRICDGISAVYLEKSDYINFKKALALAEKEWGIPTCVD